MRLMPPAPVWLVTRLSASYSMVVTLPPVPPAALAVVAGVAQALSLAHPVARVQHHPLAGAQPIGGDGLLGAARPQGEGARPRPPVPVHHEDLPAVALAHQRGRGHEQCAVLGRQGDARVDAEAVAQAL